MARCVILCCSDPDLIGHAESWSKAEALAEILVVPLPSPESSPAEWVEGGVESIRLTPGQTPEYVPLRRAMAEIDELHSARLVGVHVCDDGSLPAAALMQELLAEVKETVPPSVPVHAFDVRLFPQGTAQRTIDRAPPQWNPVLVSPEDRPGPARADVGIGNSGSSPATVALHAAGAVAGVLGGGWSPEPDLVRAAQVVPAVIRATSRIVVGGTQARNEVRAFMREDFLRSTAADVDGGRWIERTGADADAVVADAARRIRGFQRGTLTYHRPEPPERSAPPERSLWQHIRDLLSFAGWSLRLAVTDRTDSRRDRASSAVASVLVTQDMGYRLPVPESRATQHWPDWQRLDGQLSVAVEQHLSVAAESDTRPTAGLWEDVARTALGIVDGGELPDTFPRPQEKGRKVVLRPDLVAEPVDEQPRPATARSLGRHIPEACIDELASLEAIRDAPLAEALRTAADVMGAGANEPRLFGGPETLTADRMERQQIEQEQDVRSEVADALRAGALPIAGPASLLGRLRAEVVGDLLVAAADGDRWSRLARTPIEFDAEAMDRATRRFVRRMRVLGIDLAVGVATLWLMGERITRWLDARTGWEIDARYLLAAFVVVILVLATIGILRLRATSRRLAEQARRALETRQRSLQMADTAVRERNRLRNADRILAQWCEILSHSLVHGPGSIPEEDASELSRLPRPVAMQVAQPVFDVEETHQVRTWLLRTYATPGWRLDWLLFLATLAQTAGRMGCSWPPPASQAVERLRELSSDDAVDRSGRLRGLRSSLEAGTPQDHAVAGLVGVWGRSLVLAGFGVTRLRIQVPRVAGGHEVEVLDADEWLEQLLPHQTARLADEPFTAEFLGRRPEVTSRIWRSDHPRHIDVRIQPTADVSNVAVRLDVVQPGQPSDLRSPWGSAPVRVIDEVPGRVAVDEVDDDGL